MNIIDMLKKITEAVFKSINEKFEVVMHQAKIF